jgi:aminopeptidase N
MSFVTKIAAAAPASFATAMRPMARKYLYTLLCPHDANQLFPCFDQPDLKARSRCVPCADGMRVVRERSGNGVHAGVATGSPRAPVRRNGADQHLSDRVRAGRGPTSRRPASKRPITMYVASPASPRPRAIPSSRERCARGWLEGYFARPFPFRKLDVVRSRRPFPSVAWSIPARSSTTRDRFIFRERPTLTQRLGRTATIYHEVAHQWFGDLVTMRGSTTCGSRKGLPRTWRPRCRRARYVVRVVEDVLPAQQACALSSGRDARHDAGLAIARESRPGQEHYGAIVYNKAPGVLKQLDYLVGPMRSSAACADFSAHTPTRTPRGESCWPRSAPRVGRIARRLGQAVHPASPACRSSTRSSRPAPRAPRA